MKITESSAMKFDRTIIEYGIRRSRRRKTVAISVDPDLGVLVTAPVGIPAKRIDGIVKGKAQWILHRLKLLEEHAKAHPPKKFVSGESFTYLGRHYRLRVAECVEAEPAKLEDGWLKICVSGKSKNVEKAETIRASIEEWYRLHALLTIKERIEKWAPKVGALPPKLFIRNQKKRWGSCDSKGNLRINWRIIQAPMRIVDYVVVHEMTHLYNKRHDKKFWTDLGRIMPDYEARRKELRQIERSLHW